MKKIKLGQTDLEVSQIGLGCMRMARLSPTEAGEVIETALENGINFFDHADIYGGGESESIFAEGIGMNSAVREQIVLQSKCGIRSGMYDFSYDHIMRSVEGSLKRLKTDYLDVLLLHRPDSLMEPDEIARAFEELHSSGKVRWFGVSNFNPYQTELAFSQTDLKPQANQLQLSIAHADIINEGLHVNVASNEGAAKTGGVLEYCRLKNITIQAWSPMQFGQIEGAFLENPQFGNVSDELERIGALAGFGAGAAAISWILRHPAGIQPIIGTMTPDRIKDICKAVDYVMPREDWYSLLRAAGNTLP